MPSGLLIRSRLLTGCMCAAVAAVIGGCSTTAPAPTVAGKTLTVYLSAPAGLSRDAQAQDVIDAEKLAFSPSCTAGSCAPVQVGSFMLHLAVVTDDKLSGNARSAIEDKTAVAYLGELLPGDSADSLGITNAQDLLQVSPTDTAVELTQSTPAIPGAPDRYYEALGTYGRTFARMVPTSADEAAAIVAQMEQLGVATVYVKDDGSEYGRATGHAVSAAAAPKGIKVSSSPAGADAMFYAGSSASGATAALNSAAASNPKIKLFVPSALDDDSFVSALGPAAQRELYVSVPGVSPSAQGSGGQFVSAFRSAYGHPPSAQAVFGYAAMQEVLDAVRKAGSGASSRTTVVKDFFPISGHSSVLGAYSIDKNGDITFKSASGATGPTFLFLRVRAGKLVASG